MPETSTTVVNAQPAAAPPGVGVCPLVLGECVQGRLASGRHFLITSPIGLFSRAEFVAMPDSPDLQVDPAGRTKSRDAVKEYLRAQGLPVGGLLKVSTPLEHSQGFGTSTADISASLRAAAAAWGRRIDPDAISRIAIAIEPSDGSMYAGCVVYAHREGILLERLGALPPFHAVVMCTGGAVDTVAFDRQRRDFQYSACNELRLREAWHMIRASTRRRDVALMAEACTISARLNEDLLPKPYFAETLAFVTAGGAAGIMIGHSGTILALLVDASAPSYARLLAGVRRFVDDIHPPDAFEISNCATHSELEHAAMQPLDVPQRAAAMAGRQ